MEKKTIGQFIAVLRRANGLTQKQLAEQLNVSDKAVSRWERDECAPDLSLIPVIADLFGVTSDELLRGERKTPAVGTEDTAEAAAETAGPDRRSEKQLKYLLDSVLRKFRIRSLIAGGVGLLGLLGAALCATAVGTAFGGFIVGCILLVSAAVAETVLLLSARASLSTDEPGGEHISDCRRRLGETAFWVYALLVSVLAFILPLIVIPVRYFGGHDLELSFTNGVVNRWNWLCFGAVYALVTVAVLLFGWMLYRTRQQKKRTLLHRVLLVTGGILAGTAIGYTIINTAKPYPLVPWLTVFLILIAEASGGTIVFCLIRRRYDKLSEAHRAKADALWPLKWKTLLITVAVLLVTASLLAIVHQSLSWTDFVDGVPADTLEEVHEHDDKLWWWERGGADAPYLMYFEEQHRQAVTYMTAFDVGFAALLLLEIGGGFVGYFIAKQHRMPTAAQKQEAERAPENR